MSRKGSILVVDDEEIMRDVLETLLSREGYKVDLAATGEEAIKAYEKKPYDLVLMDVSMPGIGGLAALEEILKMDEEAVVVMITAYATFDTAIAAWEKGATGVIRKPFQNEQVLAIVSRGIKKRKHEEERKTLRQAMSGFINRDRIVYRSVEMENILKLVERVAQTKSTVLITGESGTGKELIARAIHESSNRADKPFVAVNCSNIPSELLESELFGHTKGAFTGAISAKKGLFEIADGGTIFLDEIGDLKPETQVKLLRFLQEREFIPLGDTRTVKVDVRIIAATNANLKEAIINGTFREDLYYRLAVVPINIPPLRERKEDILPLAKHFIKKYSKENNRRISENLSSEVLAVLEAYDYPGNVRELENIIERAVVIAQTNEITLDCLPPEIVSADHTRIFPGGKNKIVFYFSSSGQINFYEEIKKFEISLISQALEKTGGNQSQAARLLGLNTTTLNSKIQLYQISKKKA
jgi:DNA-binding NtrC family response regulator